MVDLALALPPGLKRRRGQGKWIVRQVAREVLPSSVVQRAKVGFRVPLDAWFRGGLRTMARERLLDAGSFASTVLDRRIVEQLLDDHDSGRRDEQARIWALLSLEVWYGVFFQSPLPRTPTVTVTRSPVTSS